MQQPGAAIDIGAPLRMRRPLRVAVVSETYPPEVNGVAQTIARVVGGLLGRQHRVQLIRPRQRGDLAVDAAAAASDGPFTQVLVRGLPIPRYPQLKMGLPATRALLALWAGQRPDVVHVVTEGPLGWAALNAARRLGVPAVTDFRTNFHAYSRHYGMAWLHRPIAAYLRHFHNRAASTMVPTDALRADLAAAGFERLRVVARGVDTHLFDPARRSDALRASWGAGPQTSVVLCVGRMAPEKNLGVLADAADAMRLTAPMTRLVLVGDGPGAAALRQRCPDAVFAGVQRGEALGAHYASADAFVFPSVTETFGNVVPEAMASGLAVVAYRHAAAGELIDDGVSGLLARYDDRAAFVAAAVRLAARPQWARELGTRARSVAQQLDWNRIVGLVEAEYDSALHVGAAAPGSPFSRAFAGGG